MAQQQSNVPTRKLIASVVVAALVVLVQPYIGVEIGPQALSGLVALVAAVVGYLIPPHARDKIGEIVSDTTGE